MIDISDVYKSFGQNHVLKGVNFKVHDGKSMVIIGASGQGKSVILKCLLGLTKPNSGKARCFCYRELGRSVSFS